MTSQTKDSHTSIGLKYQRQRKFICNNKRVKTSGNIQKELQPSGRRAVNVFYDTARSVIKYELSELQQEKNTACVKNIVRQTRNYFAHVEGELFGKQEVAT